MGYDPQDPDYQYLAIDKMKNQEEAATIVYDGKRSIWIPCEKDGYTEGLVKEFGEKECIVENLKSHMDVKVTVDKLDLLNPPKYLKSEDMADLTHLNEGGILDNLRKRYYGTLIYTYSGLFCIAINPYRRLPIYNPSVVKKYQGKKRMEVPPHLFNIADTAYQNMVVDRECQSMLITGESGAGKTENTKKVIAYFATVATAGVSLKPDGTEREGSLEDQIVQANPVLEAYGNAKTVRNNNSSRFGKFIRIHFGPKSTIAGADVETYLLEKSRITYQQPGIERNYHIFYFLLSNRYPDVVEMILTEPDPKKYFYINQGCFHNDSVDDNEEMQLMDDAYKVLGFSDESKKALYKCVASVLHFGEMKWKQRPREEQAEAERKDEAITIGKLLEIDGDELLKAMLKPRVKVGSEMVTKAQNLDQVKFATNAISKSIYVRMFNWIVVQINISFATGLQRSYFIGVLDIAGFEIFEYNTFEQLCINYTNERLQQFFNHHMFVLEQEEYKREGIEWIFIDFGMDLQACIDLIEKPMGILSILEEECMFPKASDKSFKEKLFENCGKNKSFGKPQKVNKNATHPPDFELYHYAGVVQYNIAGWLDKNKDPINETVVETLMMSKTPLVSELFSPPKEPEPVKEEEGKDGPKKPAGGKKGGKSSAFQTISAVHRESLGKLMATLYSTHPHFVRCIIPNETKSPGVIDAHLVLNQLRCNGVLEGIRICRKGFPNRILYPEFKFRYSVLNPNAYPKGTEDAKEITKAVLPTLTKLDIDKYRFGHTKVFFRAGTVGILEDIRDDTLFRTISFLNARSKGLVRRATLPKFKAQAVGIQKIQFNIRKYFELKNWSWQRLYVGLQPLLEQQRQEEAMARKAEELIECKETIRVTEDANTALEEGNVELLQTKNDFFMQLQAEKEAHGDIGAAIDKLQNEVEVLTGKEADLSIRVADLEKGTAGLEEEKAVLDAEHACVHGDWEVWTEKYETAEAARQDREARLRELDTNMARYDELIAKLQKEKKHLEQGLDRAEEDLSAEEDKVSHLEQVKEKLENTYEQLENQMNKERKNKSEVEKARRKFDTELKMTQETVAELEKAKSEMEEIVRKKEQDITNFNSMLEDEHSQVAQLQKRIKELLAQIEGFEEELEMERSNKQKVEKQKQDLSKEMDDLTERLDEASGATSSQIDQNRKREAELAKLRVEMEQACLIHESNLVTAKKKHQDAVNEISDQIEAVNKVKTRFEKDRSSLKSEVENLANNLDGLNKAKSNADKLSTSLEAQLKELAEKDQESVSEIKELIRKKTEMETKNTDLTRQLEDLEHQQCSLVRNRNELSKAIEDCRYQLDEESRFRNNLLKESRALTSEMDHLKEQMEEENEMRGEIARHMVKASQEMKLWKDKCECGEGGNGADVIEEMKRKLGAKVQDFETQTDVQNIRIQSYEKNISKINAELEECTVEMERAAATAAMAEKKQKLFDKTADEWTRKVGDMQRELDLAQAESRGNCADIFKMRADQQEKHDSMEGLRRENKNLADEVHEVNEQLIEHNRGAHEQEKSRKRLEMEKDELQAALEEAEGSLEQEEAKVMRATLEVAEIKQEIDKRLKEKEDEFENTRKNHLRAIDSMQASIDAEARGKAEGLRTKKKMEASINELEISLDGVNRQRLEMDKQIKKQLVSIKDIQNSLYDEARIESEIREASVMSEKRANLLLGEIEEVRTQIHAAESAKKNSEDDLQETTTRVNELTNQNQMYVTVRRKLETDVAAMQSDLDDIGNQLKSSDEVSKKAMNDAARLADELRSEQEHASHVESLRKTMEVQVRELQQRFEDAEANSTKSGNRMIQSIEQKIRELEAELDNEQKRHQETVKNMRKQDRKLKDLALQADEDRKTQERMQEMISKLSKNITTYKKQVEEAEEIAAVNLAKYRKVQQELDATQERADIAETSLAKMRAKNRSNVSQTKQIPVKGHSRFGTPEKI